MKITTHATFPKSLCASDSVKVYGTTDGWFPDFGHHAEREMGGVWMAPIKLLDGFWFRFHDRSADNVNTWIIADGYELTEWSNIFTYHANLGHTRVNITQERIAPLSAEGLLVTYTLTNRADTPVDLSCEFLARTDLYPCWFTLDKKFKAYGSDCGEWLPAERCFRAEDSENPWVCLVSCDDEPASVQVGQQTGPENTCGNGVSFSALYDFTLPGRGQRTLTFRITGSAFGKEKAAARLVGLERITMEQAAAEKQQYFSELLKRSELRSGDAVFDEVWKWVGVHTDWLTMTGEGFGRALAAGLPEYAWWFGCDNCYAVQGLLAMGRFELARETLLLLARGSEEHNGNGRIPHEITPYGLCVNPGNTQETAHYITAVWHYLQWTGDESLVRELWPLLQKSMAWTESMCCDENGFPSGYGIIEIAGLNAEMIDTITYAIQARRCYADFCRLMGDAEGEKQALAAYEKSLKALNTVMWDTAEQSYCDACADAAFVEDRMESILRHRDCKVTPEERARLDAMIAQNANKGKTGFLINHNWTIACPMETEIAPREKALPALDNLNRPEWIGPDGVYLNTLDRSMMMTISTGVFATAQAVWGRPDRALDLLERMTRTFGVISPGMLAEVSPDEGCIVQGWTAYAMFVPVVRGFFGVRPDALKKELVLRPCMPEKWQEASLKNIRIFDTQIGLHFCREGCIMRIALEAPAGLKVKLEAPAGMRADVNEVITDGKTVVIRFEPTGGNR